MPRGICIVSTGRGPGDTIAGGKGDMHVYDVGADNKLSNHKLFSDFMIDGVEFGAGDALAIGRAGARALRIQSGAPARLLMFQFANADAA